MAGTKDIKKLRIVDVQLATNEIIKKHCQENTAVSAGIKMALDILIFNLRETARLE